MPNFNSLRRLEVAFFGRFLSRFYGRHYWPLFRKLACELAEVTLEAHLRPNTFIRLLAARNLTVVEGRFPANCLLYGLEIFVAAAVIKGITCVVQCYNNKSNQPSWNFASSKPCERTRNGKMNNFCNHTQCKFHLERYFCRLFWSLHGRVFPEGCSCRRIPEVDYSIVHFKYMEKKIRKKRDERLKIEL